MRGAPKAIFERNRENARSSTGPRTPTGKALSRCNALRHGLTANPAAGVAEDPRVFERLLAGVAERLQPADAIEAALIHRIATAIWRQQRAVVAETSLAGIAVGAVVPCREEVQDWIDRILEAWKPKAQQVRDPGIKDARGKPVIRTVWSRPGVRHLDELREQEIMRSGAAITAMIELLRELATRLRDRPATLCRDECEQLSWLLGDPAMCFLPTENAPFPDEFAHPYETHRLIGKARKRPPGVSLSAELDRMIRRRIAILRTQRRVCEEPYTDEAWQHKQGAAMLLDDRVMDRLLRYEAHADRTLLRALETLARLRGVRVESLSASLTTPAGEGGGTLRVEGATVRIAAAG